MSKLTKHYDEQAPQRTPLPNRSKASANSRSYVHRTPLLDPRIRERIQASLIVNLLTEHVKGKRKMSASQVRAGLGLLAKVLPDLQTIDLTAQLTVRNVVRDEPLSPEEFARQFCEQPTLDLTAEPVKLARHDVASEAVKP